MDNVLGIKNRRTIRARVNPLDVCTIVSIFPRDIKSVKETVTPSQYFIAKGSYEKPSILHITPASWWKETGENEPLLEIPDGSVIVAESIVNDFCNGILGCDMAGRMPGLFFIPGRHEVVEVKVKFKDLLDLAKARQDNWFNSLIEAADVLWARTNGNPRSIDDNMRMAADIMGVKEQKGWMQNFVASKLSPCPACGTLRNADFPICSSCGTIVDQKKYKELGLAPIVKV